jgi:hypothetical protein
VTVQVGILVRTLGRDPGELRRFLPLAADTAATMSRSVTTSASRSGPSDGLIDAAPMAMAHHAAGARQQRAT